MSERGKKWLLWIDLVILFLSIGALAYLGNVPYSKTIGNYQTISQIILILSGLNLVVLFSIRYQNRKWLKKTAMISLFLLPAFAIGVYFLANNTSFLDSGLVSVLTIIILCLLILFALIYIFIIRKAEEIRGVLVLLLLIVINVVLQRFDFSSYAVEDLFLPGFVILTAAGMYMYGFRCLFIIEKNGYLKTISSIACTLTAFGSSLFLSIMQGNKIDKLELVYFIPAFLMTLTVLLSLAVSGYINWISLHKKILKKIMISWMFFFLIFSIRFVFPEYFKIIEIKEYKPAYQFDMKDYELQNKNGLEPE